MRMSVDTSFGRFGRKALQSLAGVVLIAFHLLVRPLRRWRTSWGATAAEHERPLPGDDLVPNASWGYTHAIALDAPPTEVWPWIVQIGQGRAGFYSYQELENLVGCRIRNATDILPRFQTLRVGDLIRLHPRAPALTVAIVEPGLCLVLYGSSPDTGDANIWSFHLASGPDTTTRLLARGRGSHGASLPSRLFFGPALMEPMGFVMSRKMLLTLRRRVSR